MTNPAASSGTQTEAGRPPHPFIATADVLALFPGMFPSTPPSAHTADPAGAGP